MSDTEKPPEIYRETMALAGCIVEGDQQLKPVDTVHGDEAVKYVVCCR